MSDAQQKIEAIKEKLTEIEAEIQICKRILKGDRVCMDCKNWVGRCVKNRIGMTANTVGCEIFEPKQK